jgi:uroporphyrin-III C-methyltransferase
VGRTSVGSLTVVGLGIGGPPQVTHEATAAMAVAERLFYIALNPLTEHWIRTLNPAAESLHDCYSADTPRADAYQRMHDRITAAVLGGTNVCAAYYGHPGVLVQATHRAIDSVRRAGGRAVMLPAVSADGCLFADLGVNPGDNGWQCFEATNFLLRHKTPDPTSELVLWQIGVIGELGPRRPSRGVLQARLSILVNALRSFYPRSHKVMLYEAATIPGQRPKVRSTTLARLPHCRISPTTTLFIPALRQRAVDKKIANLLLSFQGQL